MRCLTARDSGLIFVCYQSNLFKGSSSFRRVLISLVASVSDELRRSDFVHSQSGPSLQRSRRRGSSCGTPPGLTQSWGKPQTRQVWTRRRRRTRCRCNVSCRRAASTSRLRSRPFRPGSLCLLSCVGRGAEGCSELLAGGSIPCAGELRLVDC